MTIIRNDIQKIFKFRDIKVGTVFKRLDSVELFIKTQDLNIYRDCEEDCFFNTLDLNTFEICEIQDYEDVIIFDRSFLTVE